MRFQGLAVILAKQKWPDLVARERKRDEGLDAYAPAVLAPNGIGKGLACSTTAPLTKVKFDAQKVRERFKDVTVLIFATPAKVTGTTETEWADSIKQAYDLDLVVMSREDLVTQLMLPANAALLRSHLRIPVPLEAARRLRTRIFGGFGGPERRGRAGKPRDVVNGAGPREMVASEGPAFVVFLGLTLTCENHRPQVGEDSGSPRVFGSENGWQALPLPSIMTG